MAIDDRNVFAAVSSLRPLEADALLRTTLRSTD
jgi:hypothetical protein